MLKKSFNDFSIMDKIKCKICSNVMPASSLGGHMEKKHPLPMQWNSKTVEKVTNVARRYSPYKVPETLMLSHVDQRQVVQRGLYGAVATTEDNPIERERIGNLSISTFSSGSSEVPATSTDQYTFQVYMRETDVNYLMEFGRLFFNNGKLCYKNI